MGIYRNPNLLAVGLSLVVTMTGWGPNLSREVLQQHGLGTLSQRDVDGSTPAHLAAKQGHVECLQFLGPGCCAIFALAV